MENINGFSLNDLLQFLDFASSKRLMKQNTARTQKAACSQILGILDESEKADLRSLDIESAFRRFSNLYPAKLTPASLKTYKHRLTIAVDAFLSYRKDPTSWKPIIQQRKSPQRSDNEEPKGQSTDLSTRSSSITKTLTIPFPVREDLTITISNIPRDLKVSETKRLAAFIETLAVDFIPTAKDER